MIATRIWERLNTYEAMARASAGAERLFSRMLSRCDDYGNILASVLYLKVACLYFGDVDEDEIIDCLRELENKRILQFYLAKDSLYAHILEFDWYLAAEKDYKGWRRFRGPNGELPDDRVSEADEKPNVVRLGELAVAVPKKVAFAALTPEQIFGVGRAATPQTEAPGKPPDSRTSGGASATEVSEPGGEADPRESTLDQALDTAAEACRKGTTGPGNGES